MEYFHMTVFQQLALIVTICVIPFHQGSALLSDYHASLDDHCEADGSSICVDYGTTCAHAGDIHHTFRCQCSFDFFPVVHNGTKVCARPLTGSTEPLCETCEQQLGRCYDVDGDGRRDGCQCPVSLTGEDCETVHVFVNCTVSDFKMTICYDPHDGVNFTSGSRMHTEDHGSDPPCVGVPDDDSLCAHGTHRLELPLGEETRKQCGTYKVPSQSSIKYENRIFVNKGNGDSNDYLMFKTYCLFQTHATTTFNGPGLFSVADGWAGEDSVPYMELSIERSLGDILTDDTPIRLGDSVRFRIRLNPDDDYAAVLVESCLLSSSHKPLDHKAKTVRILSDGCPTTGGYLNSANNWRAVRPDRPFELITGLLTPPRMQAGGATYLHCWVKVCMRGETDRCEPHTCSPGKVTQHTSYGRKRRDMPDMSDKSSYLQLAKGIYFENDVTSADAMTDYSAKKNGADVMTMDRTTFVVVTSVMLLLLLVFIVSTTLLATRELRRTKSKVTDHTSGAVRPPLFHIPRNA